MNYSEFAAEAVIQDQRNTFSGYEGNLDAVPEVMKAFYREFNPIDVEMSMVRFIPAEELADVQEEYSYLNVQFVFATCNGDPIFLQDSQIYTCPHGIGKPRWELLSGDIMSYLSSLC